MEWNVNLTSLWSTCCYFVFTDWRKKNKKDFFCALTKTRDNLKNKKQEEDYEHKKMVSTPKKLSNYVTQSHVVSFFSSVINFLALFACISCTIKQILYIKRRLTIKIDKKNHLHI